MDPYICPSSRLLQFIFLKGYKSLRYDAFLVSSHGVAQNVDITVKHTTKGQSCKVLSPAAFCLPSALPPSICGTLRTDSTCAHSERNRGPVCSLKLIGSNRATMKTTRCPSLHVSDIGKRGENISATTCYDNLRMVTAIKNNCFKVCRRQLPVGSLLLCPAGTNKLFILPMPLVDDTS